jgi:hypothetical protein
MTIFVNLILDYVKGKEILDIFILEVNHDVDYNSLSLFSMTRLGNTKSVVLSRCCLLVNMTNGIKLS